MNAAMNISVRALSAIFWVATSFAVTHISERRVGHSSCVEQTRSPRGCFAPARANIHGVLAVVDGGVGTGGRSPSTL